jgi:hypothetical protein
MLSRARQMRVAYSLGMPKVRNDDGPEPTSCARAVSRVALRATSARAAGPDAAFSMGVTNVRSTDGIVLPCTAGFGSRAWWHSISMLDTEDILQIPPPMRRGAAAWGKSARLPRFLGLGKWLRPTEPRQRLHPYTLPTPRLMQ